MYPTSIYYLLLYYMSLFIYSIEWVCNHTNSISIKSPKKLENSFIAVILAFYTSK
jgi:hypothetical protein